MKTIRRGIRWTQREDREVVLLMRQALAISERYRRRPEVVVRRLRTMIEQDSEVES